MNGLRKPPGIVVMSSRGMMALMAVVGLIFVLVGLAVMTAVIPGESPAVGAIIGGSCVLFFGTITVIAVMRVIKPEPILRIDARGLVVSPNPVETHRLRWDQVADVEQFTYRGSTFLGIRPRDEAAHLRSLSLVARWLFRANRKLGKAGITIPSASVERDLDEIEAIILEYLARE